MSALLERRAREHHQQELAMSSAPVASPMSCASRVTETWHGQAADAVCERDARRRFGATQTRS